jgi:hypothetical protein
LPGTKEGSPLFPIKSKGQHNKKAKNGGRNEHLHDGDDVDAIRKLATAKTTTPKAGNGRSRRPGRAGRPETAHAADSGSSRTTRDDVAADVSAL